MSTERGTRQAHVGEQLDVPVAVLDRRADTGRRVADRRRLRCDDRAVGAGVLLGDLLAGAVHVLGVRVDHRRAGVDARERVLGVLVGRDGTSGLRALVVTPLSAASMITGR